MALYKIECKQSAKKELKKLTKSVIPKLLKTVAKLREHPYPNDCQKWRGSENTYRTES